MAVRIAIDIGGTFTDATLIDEETGRVSIAKVSTTPSDPSIGFMNAVDRALSEGAVSAAAVGSVVHATTVATNAIIEGKIARSGFITTDGFRDLLEIARQVRPTLYDPQFEKTRPLIPRDRAVGVVERLGPKGEVLLPLDEGSVRDAAALMRREGVESIAVCLLHSYVNPEHERRIGEILAEELPGRPGLALGRGRARVPRVPARQHDRDQRGDPPGRRALPRADRGAARRGRDRREAARDAVERRRLQLRGGEPPPGLHGRVGPGGGSDRLRVARRGARPPGHPLLRHGRDDREGRPDPGRKALGDQGLPGRRPRVGRHRRHVAVGLPGADTGGRPRRDRRRRRLDRLGRLGRPPPGRAAERRRRSRARSATAAAGSSRRSPTPTSCSAGSIRGTSSAARSASTSRAPGARSRSAAPIRSA